MKYVYTVAQIVFIGFAIAYMIRGNAWSYIFSGDFMILSFLMAILRKLEESANGQN